jgi:hypothetical protein
MKTMMVYGASGVLEAMPVTNYNQKAQVKGVCNTSNFEMVKSLVLV